MTELKKPYDVIVVGQGAAAFAGALYAARNQIKALVVGETFGGETATGGLIGNYPGYVGIDGGELMMNMMEQVTRYGVSVVNQRVETIVRNSDCSMYGPAEIPTRALR